MTFSVGAALLAYTLTVICSIAVARRSSNWRIRLLAFTVGLLPLCQAIVLMGRQHIWVTTEVAKLAEDLELLVSALCLTAIYLINKENGDRKTTDAKLRVAEATPMARADSH